jgi:hypothetical protein
VYYWHSLSGLEIVLNVSQLAFMFTGSVPFEKTIWYKCKLEDDQIRHKQKYSVHTYNYQTRTEVLCPHL